MKIQIENVEYKIEVGDIVEYEDVICLVVHLDAYGLSSELDYPYPIISLDTGKELNAYASLESINISGLCKLVCKSKNATLILR